MRRDERGKRGGQGRSELGEGMEGEGQAKMRVRGKKEGEGERVWERGGSERQV